MKKKTDITAGGNMLSYASIMLLAGIGIPILAAMNASLGKHLKKLQLPLNIFSLQVLS
jgi:hypothetical protein